MKAWFKRTSVEVNGVTLSVGDLIQPTLHREAFENVREEEPGELVSLESIQEETTLRLRRRSGRFFYTVELGISGDGWYRTFKHEPTE